MMKTIPDTTSPFNDFKILDHELQIIPLTRQVPPGYDQYLLPGSTAYSAKGRPGVFLFQQLAYPQYSFWLINYFTKVNEKITRELPDPSLVLHFILQNDLIYRLKGFKWQSLRETQYNLLAIPQIENEVYFEAKDYFTFDVHPSPVLLQNLSLHNPRLARFLLQANEGHFVQYYRTHRYASARVLYLVKQILEHLSGKADVILNLDDAVDRLINLALTAPLAEGELHFSYYDIERLYDAERQIRRFLDEEDILSRQIKTASMRQSKFREGFLQIFGALPHLYVLRLRMEKARVLLKSEQHFSIKDIARQVGYANPNNFTVAYRKFFGGSPEKDRSRNQQG
jgi:AraC-like DNA-binding protein